jgi:plastocyanin
MNAKLVLTVVMAAAVMLTSVVHAGAAPPRQSGPTLTVLSGWGPPAVVVDEFLPATLTVAEGTTVTWLQDTLREHTVTFLAGRPMPPQNIPQPEDPSLPQMRNPLAEYPTLPSGPWDGTTFVNSGRMQEGETFSVTFARAGVSPFVCIPHLDMVGTVTVVPAGSPGVTTQQMVDEHLAKEVALFESQLEEILATRSQPGRLSNPDGTTMWFVRNGTDQRFEEDLLRGRLTVRQYLPSRLTIQEGDSVVWYTDTRVNVHTVTFPVQNEPPPANRSPRNADGSLVPLELLTPSGAYRGDPSSLDWPRIVENPVASRVSRPSAVYDPTQFFNSGQMGDNPAGRAWALTFETPGTFTYFCIPHVAIGQIGEVTVVPR